jgi:hypothetical protein
VLSVNRVSFGGNIWMSTEFSGEIEALGAIFEDELTVSWNLDAAVVVFTDKARSFSIHFMVPAGYPLVECLKCRVLLEGSQIVQRRWQAEIDNFIAANGETIAIFGCIELLRSLVDAEKPEQPMTSSSEITTEGYYPHKVQETLCNDEVSPIRVSTATSIQVIHGPVTSFNKSSFQAHLAAVKSQDEVNDFRNQVVQDKKVIYNLCNSCFPSTVGGAIISLDSRPSLIYVAMLAFCFWYVVVYMLVVLPAVLSGDTQHFCISVF